MKVLKNCFQRELLVLKDQSQKQEVAHENVWVVMKLDDFQTSSSHFHSVKQKVMLSVRTEKGIHVFLYTVDSNWKVKNIRIAMKQILITCIIASFNCECRREPEFFTFLGGHICKDEATKMLNFLINYKREAFFNSLQPFQSCFI